MKPIPGNQLLDQLHWRYATKKFDSKRKISPADWATLEQALVLTPSSFGLQPWKFIVVTDPEVRRKLVAASWDQRQIVDASHLVVFAIRKDLSEKDVDAYVDHISAVRQAPRESLQGYRDLIVGFVGRRDNGFDINAWAAKQTYIALGNFLTSAALMGIDACPMEGIDPQQYNQILGLDKQGLSAVVVATAGYRAENDSYAGLPKVRFPKQEVLVEV